MSAPWVAEIDGVQQLVVLGVLEHPDAGALRIAATMSVGWRSKATLTIARNRSSSRRIIASARPGLVPISL